MHDPTTCGGDVNTPPSEYTFNFEYSLHQVICMTTSIMQQLSASLPDISDQSLIDSSPFFWSLNELLFQLRGAFAVASQLAEPYRTYCTMYTTYTTVLLRIPRYYYVYHGIITYTTVFSSRPFWRWEYIGNFSLVRCMSSPPWMVSTAYACN